MAMAAHVVTLNGLCASLIDRPVGYEEIADIEKADGFIKSYAAL